MDSDTIIRFENVTKAYDTSTKIYALRNVSFEVDRGDKIAVTGPSGSGKSTLLNLIGGLDKPSEGDVFFDGIPLSTLNDDQCTRLRREKIGMIFQSFNLLPTLTALENVSLTMRLQGTGQKSSSLRAGEMLERVGLTNRSSHFPDEMSGGECQRVAIARALIFNPPLLLADEPTGNLDTKSGKKILKLLDDLNTEYNTSIILVTHDKQAASHCGRILKLRDGELVDGNDAL